MIVGDSCRIIESIKNRNLNVYSVLSTEDGFIDER